MVDFNYWAIKSLDAVSTVVPKSLRLKTSSILKWLFIGCVIRLLLIPIFSHPDLTTTLWVSLTFATKHQLILSPDPPLVFISLGAFYSLVMPFFPTNFLHFINSGVAYTPNTNLIILALLQPNINSVLLIAKLPFLLLDILSAFILLNLFNDGVKGFTAFKMWLLNPISLYVSYIFGQYDIFAVFFILMALFFIRKNKYGWSMVSLGIASAFKAIGIALMPLVIVFFLKNQGTRDLKHNTLKLGRIILLGLLPLIALSLVYTQIPSYYESVNFAIPREERWAFNGFYGQTFYSRGEAVLSPLFSGLFTYILDFSISLSSNQLPTDVVYLSLLSYAIVFLALIYSKDVSFEKVCGYFTVFLLCYYAFSAFLPQWFLWIQPFLIILVAENRQVFKKLYWLLVPLFFLYIWQWDAGLTTNLISPLIPQAISWPGPLALIDSLGLDRVQILGAFRTLLTGVCLFTSFFIVQKVLRGKTENKIQITETSPHEI